MKPLRYIVIFQQVIASSRGFEISYSWDERRFNGHARAVSHGFKTRGSDDFNIGGVRGNRLDWFGWMHKELDHDLSEIAEQIGLEAKPEATT